MKGFDILHLNSAIQHRSHFDLSFPHLTTMAIGQIQPVLNRALVPGDVFNVNGKVFSRCAPMYVPTYGRLDLKTASFFVPYHQVAEDADAWFSGKTSYMGQTPVFRYFTMKELLYFFVSGSDVTNAANPAPPISVSESSDDGHYDFTYIDENGDRKWAYLTGYGRWVYKFLSALGYQIPSNGSFDDSDDDGWYFTTGLTKLNAFPLLCAAKAYNDWMSNSAKYDVTALSSLLLDIRQGKNHTGYTASVGELSIGALNVLLSSIRLCYENDYFTSSWQTPQTVATNNFNYVHELEYPVSSSATYSDDTIATGLYGSVLRHGIANTSLTEVSQRGLDFLRAFDNWVRRNNFAGSRDVQQIYARYGIKPEYYKTHYAEVLGTTVCSMNVGDVMATTTSGIEGAWNVLGDYAGKGILSGDVNFNCQASDFGQLITLAWISVHAAYPFGFDRNVLRSEVLDFFTPEFDGLSGDAISDAEVFVDPKSESTQVDGSGTFGYTERYNDYRCSRDQVTGDFRIYDTMSAWHFGRDMSSLLTGSMVTQSDDVMYYPHVDSQFNRIFQVVGNPNPNANDSSAVDAFYSTWWFNIDAVRPMKNFNEVPNLGTGNTSVPKNGNVIN